MAARRLGQVEAYLTVREVLSEASTAADGVLSSERSGFYRCRYVTLGLPLLQRSTIARGYLTIPATQVSIVGAPDKGA